MKEEQVEVEEKEETNLLPDLCNFRTALAYNTTDELIGHGHFMRLLTADLITSRVPGPELTSSQGRKSCRQTKNKQQTHRLVPDWPSSSKTGAEGRQIYDNRLN